MINKINVFFFLEIWAFSYLNFVYLFNRHLPPKINWQVFTYQMKLSETFTIRPKKHDGSLYNDAMNRAVFS